MLAINLQEFGFMEAQAVPILTRLVRIKRRKVTIFFGLKPLQLVLRMQLYIS